MKTTWTLKVALFALGASFPFAACSSSSSNGGGSDAGATEDAPVHHDSAVTQEAGPCAPATSDSDCRSQGTACIDCCSCFHQTGVTTFNTALETCVCQATVCGTQCAASLCATPVVQPATGDACDTCVNGAIAADAGSGCNAKIVTACRADPDCIALLTCIDGTKPNDPNACP
jgi:hypothetical protein